MAVNVYFGDFEIVYLIGFVRVNLSMAPTVSYLQGDGPAVASLIIYVARYFDLLSLEGTLIFHTGYLVCSLSISICSYFKKSGIF